MESQVDIIKFSVQGEISKLVKEKGYGFIKVDEQNIDVFFHHSNIHDVYFNQLVEGDVVVFNMITTPKGLEAVDINLIELDAQIEENNMYN